MSDPARAHEPFGTVLRHLGAGVFLIKIDGVQTIDARLLPIPGERDYYGQIMTAEEIDNFAHLFIGKPVFARVSPP